MELTLCGGVWGQFDPIRWSRVSLARKICDAMAKHPTTYRGYNITVALNGAAGGFE
jgi:hypothetical protein